MVRTPLPQVNTARKSIQRLERWSSGRTKIYVQLAGRRLAKLESDITHDGAGVDLENVFRIAYHPLDVALCFKLYVSDNRNRHDRRDVGQIVSARTSVLVFLTLSGTEDLAEVAIDIHPGLGDLDHGTRDPDEGRCPVQDLGRRSVAWSAKHPRVLERR